MTIAVDASRLNELIPQLVSFGRRTVAQQCVTSAAYIVKRAMDNTEKIEVDFIDARLETKVVSYTRKGRVSKAKKRTQWKKSFPVGKGVPLGVLVIMARMRQGSNFNNLTGGKWAIPSSVLPTGPGTAKARQLVIMNLNTRQISSRRSTAGLLKFGWVKPLQVINASPHMVRRGMRLGGAIRSVTNDNKELRTDRLGEATIAETGDSILVTCINFSMRGSNSQLEARHEHYAQLQALPPLKEAVAWEESNIMRRISELTDAGIKQQFTDI